MKIPFPWFRLSLQWEGGLLTLNGCTNARQGQAGGGPGGTEGPPAPRRQHRGPGPDPAREIQRSGGSPMLSNPWPLTHMENPFPNISSLTEKDNVRKKGWKCVWPSCFDLQRGVRTQDVLVVLAGPSAGPCSNLDFYAHLSGPDRGEFQVQIPKDGWRGLLLSWLCLLRLCGKDQRCLAV